MGLAQKLLVNHQHGDGSGGVITHPSGYELFANLFFLGQRARVFDRLVALSGAQHRERVLDVGCGTGISPAESLPSHLIPQCLTSPSAESRASSTSLRAGFAPL
jgi:hypothetical protein